MCIKNYRLRSRPVHRTTPTYRRQRGGDSGRASPSARHAAPRPVCHRLIGGHVGSGWAVSSGARGAEGGRSRWTASRASADAEPARSYFSRAIGLALDRSRLAFLWLGLWIVATIDVAVRLSVDCGSSGPTAKGRLSIVDEQSSETALFQTCPGSYWTRSGRAYRYSSAAACSGFLSFDHASTDERLSVWRRSDASRSGRPRRPH